MTHGQDPKYMTSPGIDAQKTHTRRVKTLTTVSVVALISVMFLLDTYTNNAPTPTNINPATSNHGSSNCYQPCHNDPKTYTIKPHQPYNHQKK